ncbi:MAG: OmpA family protein [Elusimicrobia bacterium]|nr:OmpA family protein [Elusimicrobiota bacterium]MBD3411945.1 OmpA family protein [Elusimicrobiota bacterium]
MRAIRFLVDRRASGSPIWLTIYSDLMTNLMLFFLLMYGMTIMPEDMRKKIVEGLQTKFKPQVTEKHVEQVLRRIQEEESARWIHHYVISEKLRKYIAVEIDEQRIRIILRNPILFNPGSHELQPQGAQVIKEIGAVLSRLNRPIVVEGHTDNTPIVSGTYSSNWELSLERALTVLHELEECDIDPKYLSFEGYGEWRPVYPNDTELGRTLNRRIEIHVLREERKQ